MPVGPEMDALVESVVFHSKPRRVGVPGPDDLAHPALREPTLTANGQMRVPVHCRETGRNFELVVSAVRTACPACGELVGKDATLAPQPYSTSDAAALEVLKAFPYFRVERTATCVFVCTVSTVPRTGNRRPDGSPYPEHLAGHSTFAGAACRAALLANL